MKPSTNNAGTSRLKKKNKILKEKIRKLGGQIGTMAEMPAELEHQFLKSILAFDDAQKNRKRIIIGKKLGKSFKVRPLAEIADDEIDHEWISLHERMCERGIDLCVGSPNISSRELYRFTVEEFLKKKIEAFDIPGTVSCFFYDEYYPDVKYENERLAVDECIRTILSKETLYPFGFTAMVNFNDYPVLDAERFCNKIADFQDLFQSFGHADLQLDSTELSPGNCMICGSYTSSCLINEEVKNLSGSWSVNLELDLETGYWDIRDVRLEGIDEYLQCFL